jgi:uncharacterized RDD family membrane protein YckC
VDSRCERCRALIGREVQPEDTEGFGPRAGARLIDLLARLVVTALAAGFTSAALIAARAFRLLPAGWSLDVEQSGAFNLLTSLLGSIGGTTLMTLISGASVGKLFLSLRVVSLDGSPVRLRGAFLREVGYLFDLLFFGWVGKRAMDRSPLHQRHGDVLARTVVVRAAARPSRPVNETALLVLLGLVCEGLLLMVIFAGTLLHPAR